MKTYKLTKDELIHAIAIYLKERDGFELKDAPKMSITRPNWPDDNFLITIDE